MNAPLTTGPRGHLPTAALLVLAAAMAAPAPASAALPAAKSKTIVPGRSIAGVKVGMTAAQALAAWGSAGTDCTAQSTRTDCYYRGTARQGDAHFTLDTAGKVTLVSVQIGQMSNGNPIYSGPLTKWRTSKRIGLGSTTRQVVKAYPKAKGAPYGIQLGSGSHTTALETSGGRMFAISVGTLPN